MSRLFYREYFTFFHVDSLVKVIKPKLNILNDLLHILVLKHQFMKFKSINLYTFNRNLKVKHKILIILVV